MIDGTRLRTLALTLMAALATAACVPPSSGQGFRDDRSLRGCNSPTAIAIAIHNASQDSIGSRIRSRC